MEKILFLLLVSFFTSCSVIERTAVNTTADIAYTGHKEMQKMSSWSEVKSAIPASLSLAETLLPTNPTNLTLLTQIIKGYAALGFAIFETEALQSKGNSELESYYLQQASISYSRSVNFGQRYLKEKQITLDDLYKGINNESELYALFDKQLTNKDYAALFFLGQSLASLINLNRDHIKLVNHLPMAQSLINYVCKNDPNFESGMCQMFDAIYYSSRPKTLGGNPELGKKIFLETIKKYPFNLMFHVSYLQYNVLPQKKFEEFKTRAKSLEEQFQQFWDSQRYPHYVNTKNDFIKYEENNLYNMISSLRLKAFIKNEHSYH